MNKRQRDRLNRLLPNGVPRWVRCYDNGGETADRYTVVFTGVYRNGKPKQFVYLGMSANPCLPQGFGQHGEALYPVDSPGGRRPPAIGRRCHLGVRVRFEDLPAPCRRLVLKDYGNLWELEGAGV